MEDYDVWVTVRVMDTQLRHCGLWRQHPSAEGLMGLCPWSIEKKSNLIQLITRKA